jgi:hypothetical protein
MNLILLFMFIFKTKKYILLAQKDHQAYGIFIFYISTLKNYCLYLFGRPFVNFLRTTFPP